MAFKNKKKDLGEISTTVIGKQNRQQGELEKLTNKITGMKSTLDAHSASLAKITVNAANYNILPGVNFKESFDPFAVQYAKDKS